jgi:multidrug efflux pump subunit AcrA (membrane-fusion protein)
MKRLIIGLSLVGIAGAVTVGLLLRGGSTPAASYRFATVDRGDIVSTVSATGTLSAVRTVAVGTQVSGQIATLGADFNDHVRRGQVIARLDSTILVQAVAQSQTDLDKAQANVAQTGFLAEQGGRLQAAGSMTDTDHRLTLYNAEVARASLLALDCAPGATVNIATGRQTTDRLVFEAVAAAVGYAGPPLYGPERAGDLQHSCLDITHARRLLGWEPQIEFAEGVRRTVAHLSGEG